MINLSEKLGEMTFDGLITDIKPAPEVRGGVIRKLSAAATLKRGTILAKSSGTAGDGKLVVLGSAAKENETLTPDCILTSTSAPPPTRRWQSTPPAASTSAR